MKLSRGYDPIENRITFSISTKLLVDYFNNFNGLVNSSNMKSLFKDIKVKRLSMDTAEVSFSFPKEASLTKIKDGVVVTMPPQVIEPLIKTFYKFEAAAASKKSKSTEFVPLKGYPIEDLRNDIKEAIKNKRNLCLIGSFDEYLTLTETSKKDATVGMKEVLVSQYMIKYGTDEYSNVCLEIIYGDINNLSNNYKLKLKKESWI